MAPQTYDFLTNWRFENCAIHEVADILENTAWLPRWWPELFKTVEIVKPGTGHSLGQVARCSCRAKLPYTLRFTYTVVEERYPYGSTIASSGDLFGTGVWTLTSRDGGVDVQYRWTVQLEKPFLRLVSPLLRQLFAANHTWSMNAGEEGLRRELQRRRAAVVPPREENLSR